MALHTAGKAMIMALHAPRVNTRWQCTHFIAVHSPGVTQRQCVISPQLTTKSEQLDAYFYDHCSSGPTEPSVVIASQVSTVQ